jgi:hypothetical protein
MLFNPFAQRSLIDLDFDQTLVDVEVRPTAVQLRGGSAAYFDLREGGVRGLHKRQLQERQANAH